MGSTPTNWCTPRLACARGPLAARMVHAWLKLCYGGFGCQQHAIAHIRHFSSKIIEFTFCKNAFGLPCNLQGYFKLWAEMAYLSIGQHIVPAPVPHCLSLSSCELAVPMCFPSESLQTSCINRTHKAGILREFEPRLNKPLLAASNSVFGIAP